MARYDDCTLRAVFTKSNGKCHLCGGQVAFRNYNALGARGRWEVDHSVAVSEGGTDHLNNLYPAHIACNRSKQARSSHSARQANDLSRAPMAAAALERWKLDSALTGVISGGLLGARFGGPVGFWIGAILFGLAAYAVDPNDS